MSPSIRFPHLRAACAALRPVSVPILALVLAGGADSLAAQPQAELVGERVRVTAPGLYLKGEVGQVVGAGPHELRVEFEESGVHGVAWDEMDRLEISEGSRTYGTRGFLIGAAGGAVLGVVLMQLDGDREAPECRPSDSIAANFGCALGRGLSESVSETLEIYGVVAMGVLGGVAGMVVGKLTHGENWVTRSPALDGVSVRPSFSGGRPGFSVRLPLGR